MDRAAERAAELELYVALGVFCLGSISIALLLLLLRDTRGRFSIRRMFFIVTTAAIAIWALAKMMK